MPNNPQKYYHVVFMLASITFSFLNKRNPTFIHHKNTLVIVREIKRKQLGALPFDYDHLFDTFNIFSTIAYNFSNQES